MKEIDILLVMDYLDGHWDPEKEAQLQSLIQAGDLGLKELQEWKHLYQQTGKLPQPIPSGRLQENFYAMLSAEPGMNPWQQIVRWFRQDPAIRLSHIAVGMVVLLIGIAIGYQLSPAQQYEDRISSLSGEMEQMREAMVLTLLDQPSAVQRLKAVSISTDLSGADGKIYHALLKTLNEDTQVNVRLAALEALLRYGQDPIVRRGLVQSIPQQESPLVQIALANAMVALQETQAVDPLKNLLEQHDLNEVAKQAIEQSIQILI